MSYDYDEEMRKRRETDKLIEEIQEKARQLGYKVSTKEEMLATEERMRKMDKRDAKIRSFLGFIRSVVYTPLSIAFRAVSVVTRIIAGISSLGLIAGVYCLYQSFCALKDGVPWGEIETLSQAGSFIVFPFIAYFVAEVTERIWIYLHDNAF